MTDWHEKSMRALQLAGMSDRTQECYTRSVRRLVEFCDKTPDQISETDLQDYFLHRRNVSDRSPIRSGTGAVCPTPRKRAGLHRLREAKTSHETPRSTEN